MKTVKVFLSFRLLVLGKPPSKVQRGQRATALATHLMPPRRTLARFSVRKPGGARVSTFNRQSHFCCRMSLRNYTTWRQAMAKSVCIIGTLLYTR